MPASKPAPSPAGLFLWKVRTTKDACYDGHLWITTNTNTFTLALEKALSFIKTNRPDAALKSIVYRGYIDA